MASKSSKKKTEQQTTDVAVKNNATTNNYNYALRLSQLTDEEREKYRALTEKINSSDLSTLHKYGEELDAVVGANGDKLLQSVKCDGEGEIVGLVTQLLQELNMINIDDLTSDNKFKKFIAKVPFLKNLVTSMENVKIKYNDIKTNVDAISEKMGDAKIVAMKDNSTLQEIFDNTVVYIERLQDLIMGAKVLLQDTEAKIKEMDEHPENYKQYEISDMMDFKNALEKRIADMQITEAVFQQNLMQIRATQGNNLAIAERSDTIVSKVIPAWKTQIALAVTINNQSENVRAQDLLTDTANKILTENAKNLHMNSVTVAKANEKSVISLETLKTTTNELIQTIEEVRKIHEDGVKERALVEDELHKMAIQLEEAVKGSK
jgi:uncharacterized protein YaaN involved in tellurite resistance